MTERGPRGEHLRGEDTPRPGASGGAPDGDGETCDLFVFSAGGRLFAVFAEEVEAVAGGLRPAPLPFAPPTVLGVVPVRGRMRTAIDPLRLLDASAPPTPDARAARADAPILAATDTPARLFVALAGDEQLALACDSAEGRVTIRDPRLAPGRAPDSPERARAPLERVRTPLEHEGRTITLLDSSRLFEAAMRGTDRRRRRS